MAFSAFTNDLGTTFVELVAGKVDNEYKKFLLEEDAAVVELLVSYLYKDRIPTFEVTVASSSTSIPASGTSLKRKLPPVFDLPSPELYPVPNDSLQRDVGPLGLRVAFENKCDRQKQSIDLEQRREWRKSYAKLFLRKQSIQANKDIGLYQTTLLRLCFLAEKIEWSQLFNAALGSYVEGEALIQRPISVEHVRLIYQKTTAGTKLRQMALDATASGETKISMSIYKPLTSENEDFLDDILDRLQGPKHIFESVLEAAQEGAYDMPENGKAKGRNRKHSHIERLISRGDVFASINEILNAALFLM